MPEREPDIIRILDTDKAKCTDANGTFTSSDQYMVQALMMKNIYPYKAGYYLDSKSMVIYFAEDAELQKFVGDLLSGRGNEITFTYADSWRAANTWIMLLRYFQNAAKNMQ